MSDNQKTALYEYLKTAILTMELQPGSDLEEIELSQRFGLSRTPLREIFRQLAGEGFIELRPSRGARVSEMSYATLRDFFQAAPMIYGAILRLAALGATPAQIAALKASQESFKRALRSGEPSDRALANNEFHKITGDMAGNVYLLPSFSRLLIDHARVGMTFYSAENSDEDASAQKACAQHDAIIAAIENCDAERAGHLAEEHWNLSRHQIEQFVMPNALNFPLGQIAPEIFQKELR